jgi:hypothetical protein
MIHERSHHAPHIRAVHLFSDGTKNKLFKKVLLPFCRGVERRGQRNFGAATAAGRGADERRTQGDLKVLLPTARPFDVAFGCERAAGQDVHRGRGFKTPAVAGDNAPVYPELRKCEAAVGASCRIKPHMDVCPYCAVCEARIHVRFETMDTVCPV